MTEYLAEQVMIDLIEKWFIKMIYDLLHTINERATPKMFMLNKHAIQLYKIF